MDKQKLLRLFYRSGVSRGLRALKSNKLTVLSLHRISPEPDYFFNPITPRHFELLLQYVLKHYSVISFADIPGLLQLNAKSAKPYLILSFDDGYHDFIEYALPLLSKYNLASNHNVVNSCANSNAAIWTQRLNHIFNHCKEYNVPLTFELHENGPTTVLQFEGNWMAYYLAVFKLLLNTPWQKRMEFLKIKERELGVKKPERMMNWDEINECSRHRVEIGSHTYHHDVLSTIEDVGSLQYEILQSKKEIEEKINKPVNILALPNGQSNAAVNEICMTGGFTHILYVDDKVNDWNDGLLKVGTPIHRVYLIEESPEEMFLRIELFHSKMRKYV